MIRRCLLLGKIHRNFFLLFFNSFYFMFPRQLLHFSYHQHSFIRSCIANAHYFELTISFALRKNQMSISFYVTAAVNVFIVRLL